MSSEEREVPFVFEMPLDRLLSDGEILPLTLNGIHVRSMKCPLCGKEGWVTDYREYCKLSCYAKAKKMDPRSLDLVRQAVLLDGAALTGDEVEYGGKKLKVLATDCTEERIRRKYELKFNYVLKCQGTVFHLKNLETPLIKIKEEPINEINRPKDDKY
jgi:hypothetical protein